VPSRSDATQIERSIATSRSKGDMSGLAHLPFRSHFGGTGFLRRPVPGAMTVAVTVAPLHRPLG
jgi:hypothetical protein